VAGCGVDLRTGALDKALLCFTEFCIRILESAESVVPSCGVLTAATATRLRLPEHLDQLRQDAPVGARKLADLGYRLRDQVHQGDDRSGEPVEVPGKATTTIPTSRAACRLFAARSRSRQRNSLGRLGRPLPNFPELDE